jgi:short-subunit dehydrogenase
VRLTYAIVPAFVKRGGGTIINVASVLGIASELLNDAYGGTKAFVLAFSRSLHKELAEAKVHVQTVLQRATATEFWDIAGTLLDQVPSHIVMKAGDVVDAALAGLDQGNWSPFVLARYRRLGGGAA